MNWIDIDKTLYRIIGRHDTVDDVYAEVQKTFKWDQSQAKAAIDPLLLRHSTLKPAETAQKTTKRKPK